MDEKIRIRQLEDQLASYEISADAADNTPKIDLLNELAWLLADTDLKRAYALSETAYALSTPPKHDAPSYQAGIAYSLRTRGYINHRVGDLTQAMSQLLAAQPIFEALNLDDGLADVFDAISGTYYQFGGLPDSLNFIYRQLEVAQRAGDYRRVGNALNNLAVVYATMGDYERANATLQQNLKVALENGDPRIESLSYLNLAENYLNLGEHEKALEYCLRALPVCRQAGFAEFEEHSLHFLGKAYHQIGDLEQALYYLEMALAFSRRIESEANEIRILTDLAQVYRSMGELDFALENLHMSVDAAEALGMKIELFEAHQQLSEIYEDQGNLEKALFHYKQYRATKELVYSEKADQQLKVLQVTHDFETARKEAEMFRIKTEELEKEVQISTVELRDMVVRLQHEVEERERAEAEIQEMVETLEQRVAARTDELATFFDLTLLTGQGLNLTEAFDQALPRIIEITQSQAIGIVLIDADRKALQLVAQVNLPGSIQPLSQIAELPLELQRWLEQPNNPLNVQDLQNIPSLHSTVFDAGFRTFLGAQIRIGNRVEGIFSCFRFTEQGYSVDETALVMALAEQIGIMVENHRLRQNAAEMAVLEERQRLARDLHDSVSQSLYSLSLFSRAGREAAEDGDRDRLVYSLTELERNTLHALREMRLLLYELRPADLEQGGLISAIELRLNTVERRVGLQLDVHLDEQVGLSPACELQLYHIIVEALNNVVKHAAATCLTLHMIREDSQLRLRIIDDGQGFDLAQKKGGLGLGNIRERVARLKGQLSIVSAQGEGTRLEITVPCKEEII